MVMVNVLWLFEPVEHDLGVTSFLFLIWLFLAGCLSNRNAEQIESDVDLKYEMNRAFKRWVVGQSACGEIESAMLCGDSPA